MAQMHRVQKAHMALERSTKTSMSGQSPHQVATINVDDDQWIAFNKEYYKLREMEYYAGYKIPEVVALRGKARAVTKTEEMGDIKSHWKEVTQQKQHQVVAHHQAEFVLAAAKALSASYDTDVKMLNPTVSPVMFNAWHALHLYFTAMMEGDLEPTLDFIIDGKYDAEFVKAINPQFPAPENYPEDLYLY